jgi:hypothetical protein
MGCPKMDKEVILPHRSWGKHTFEEVVTVLRFTAVETMIGG